MERISLGLSTAHELPAGFSAADIESTFSSRRERIGLAVSPDRIEGLKPTSTWLSVSLSDESSRLIGPASSTSSQILLFRDYETADKCVRGGLQAVVAVSLLEASPAPAPGALEKRARWALALL